MNLLLNMNLFLIITDKHESLQYALEAGAAHRNPSCAPGIHLTGTHLSRCHFHRFTQHGRAGKTTLLHARYRRRRSATAARTRSSAAAGWH